MSSYDSDSFEIVDHGITQPDYFQGCGVAFTEWNHVATGIGSTFNLALDDAIEMMASSGEVDEALMEFIGSTSGRNYDDNKASGHAGSESYYHVSIRY